MASTGRLTAQAVFEEASPNKLRSDLTSKAYRSSEAFCECDSRREDMAVAAEPPAKRSKVEEGPANVILQFESETGELTGK